MRLADAGRPEQQQRIAVGHPAAGRQLADLRGIERGLGIEVEAVERRTVRELGDAQAHLDAPLLAMRDLRLAQQRQRFAQGQVAARRPRRAGRRAGRASPSGRAGSASPAGGRSLGITSRLPPRRSYSASGRNSSPASGCRRGRRPRVCRRRRCRRGAPDRSTRSRRPRRIG